jgi:phage tail sheath gpL-like
MSSPNISFKSVPSSIRKPGRYTEYNAEGAITSLPSVANKVLIVAQKTSSGIATVDTVYPIFSSADSILYAGAGSIADLMVKALFKANPNINLSLITQADAGGSAAAVGTVTIATTATKAGSMDLWVANKYINVAVAIGDTPTVVVVSLYNKLKEIEADLPVVATKDAAILTLTAKNLGTSGNQIAIAYKINNADCTATVVQPTGGTGDPVYTNPLAAAFPGKFDIIVSSLNDAANLAILKTHVTNSSSPTEGRPCIAVYGYTGVQATLETLAGTTLNYERFSVAFHPYTKTTQSGHSLDYEIAAAYAGVIASEEDPAMPLNGLVLTDIGPAAIANRLSRTQQESCLANGVTPLIVGVGEQVAIVRAVSNYIKNATGTTDPAYLDITTIRTLDYVRLSIETREALRFPRSKLSTKTPAKVRAQIIDVLTKLEELEIVENVSSNLDGIVVEKDSTDPNRLNALIPADVVNGLHVLANRINLVL